MTVKDLIEALSRLNPDAAVIVSGYESGYLAVDRLDTRSVVGLSGTSWYNGDIDDAGDGFYSGSPCTEPFEAIALCGGKSFT